MSNDAFSDDSLFDDDSVAPESDFSEDFTDESMSDAAMDSMDDSTSDVGKTTADEPVGSAEISDDEKKGILASFNIFDAMLLLSLIFVSLATLFLFLELNTFGDFPGSFPWRTTEFLN